VERSKPTVSTKGVVTLGELVGGVGRFDVRCRRCGRMRLARLIADHGAETGLPDLAERLAAGCPKAETPDLGEHCFVYFPQLPERHAGRIDAVPGRRQSADRADCRPSTAAERRAEQAGSAQVSVPVAQRTETDR
jgi:hypothetical protein